MTAHSLGQHSTTQIPAFKGFFNRIVSLLAVRRQRRKLAYMSDAALSDIGVTRAEALAEADRPVWDAPHQWLR